MQGFLPVLSLFSRGAQKLSEDLYTVVHHAHYCCSLAGWHDGNRGAFCTPSCLGHESSPRPGIPVSRAQRSQERSTPIFPQVSSLPWLCQGTGYRPVVLMASSQAMGVPPSLFLDAEARQKTPAVDICSLVSPWSVQPRCQVNIYLFIYLFVYFNILSFKDKPV